MDGKVVMQPQLNPPAREWCLRRLVLPQHTDHAGVMWHGAYLGWLEEARVGALASVGLAYSALSERGLELPVVALAMDYRQPLRHGDAVEVRSVVESRRRLRLIWSSRFLNGRGELAAEARVDLVVLDLGPDRGQRRLLRHYPPDLETALKALALGPPEDPEFHCL